MEQKHHLTSRDDVFLCIPPLYHTGANFTGWAAYMQEVRPSFERNHTRDYSRCCLKEQCTIVWLLVPWAQDILTALDRGDIKLEDYNWISGD